MRRAPAVCRLAVIVLGACASAAVGGNVSVNLTANGGVSPEDSIVVFDPLDTAVPPVHTTATIDQIDKQFVPKVNVIRTGTSVIFSNSDHVRHQVYSFSAAKTFTLKLYAGSPQTPILFDMPGLVVLGCNIHDNMLGFVGVVDTPYFAKSPPSGSTSFNLPPGRYRLRVWHPHLADAVPAKEIAVTSAPQVIALTLDLTAGTPGLSPWPE